MKSNSFLLRIPGVSKGVKVISFVWDTITTGSSSESELSARVRYSVVENISEEMEQGNHYGLRDVMTKSRPVVYLRGLNCPTFKTDSQRSHKEHSWSFVERTEEDS